MQITNAEDGKLKLSMIVPTKNRVNLLKRFLPTLAEQDTSDFYEIIVVDNGSTDSTIRVVNEMAERWHHIRIITEEKPSSAAARHAGAIAALSSIVMFVDDDMKAEPDLITQHLEAHKKNPGCCILGNILSASSRHPFERMMAYIFDGARKSLSQREPKAVDYWSGNVSISRKLYFKVGGYNQLLNELGYGKDVDFGKRLLENNIRLLFVPEAKTYHHFTERFADRLKKSYDFGVTSAIVKEKYADLPIIEVDVTKGKFNKSIEYFCRFMAAIMEPFDRGRTVPPLKPLTFIYDLGIRTATQRGMIEYLNGQFRLNSNTAVHKSKVDE